VTSRASPFALLTLGGRDDPVKGIERARIGCDTVGIPREEELGGIPEVATLPFATVLCCLDVDIYDNPINVSHGAIYVVDSVNESQSEILVL